MLSEFIPFPDYYIVVLISTLITSPKLHTHHRHINKRDKMDVLLEWKLKITTPLAYVSKVKKS